MLDSLFAPRNRPILRWVFLGQLLLQIFLLWSLFSDQQTPRRDVPMIPSRPGPALPTEETSAVSDLEWAQMRGFKPELLPSKPKVSIGNGQMHSDPDCIYQDCPKGQSRWVHIPRPKLLHTAPMKGLGLLPKLVANDPNSLVNSQHPAPVGGVKMPQLREKKPFPGTPAKASDLTVVLSSSGSEARTECAASAAQESIRNHAFAKDAAEFKVEVAGRHGTPYVDVSSLTTKYVLLMPEDSLLLSPHDTRLQEMMMILDNDAAVSVVGGARLHPDLEWFNNCQRFVHAGWKLKMQKGGSEAPYKGRSMICDYVEGPWMIRVQTLKDIPLKKELGLGMWLDWFVRLRSGPEVEGVPFNPYRENCDRYRNGLVVLFTQSMFGFVPDCNREVMLDNVARADEYVNTYKALQVQVIEEWDGGLIFSCIGTQKGVCDSFYDDHTIPEFWGVEHPAFWGGLTQVQLMQGMDVAMQFLLDLSEKHDLRWWMAGGTILGTLRGYDGLLPTDAGDIDFFMHPDDYEKAKELVLGYCEEKGWCCEIRKSKKTGADSVANLCVGKPYEGLLSFYNSDDFVPFTEVSYTRFHGDMKVPMPVNPGLWAEFGQHGYDDQFMELKRWRKKKDGKTEDDYCTQKGHNACIARHNTGMYFPDRHLRANQCHYYPSTGPDYKLD